VASMSRASNRRRPAGVSAPFTALAPVTHGQGFVDAYVFRVRGHAALRVLELDQARFSVIK